jgi:hypothetical protein
MKTRPIKFDDDKIPAWTYDGCEPGRHTFAAAIALSGLEDTMIRLSAALQTRLLGHNVFGKHRFMLRKDGTYVVSHKVLLWNGFRIPRRAANRVIFGGAESADNSVRMLSQRRFRTSSNENKRADKKRSRRTPAAA